MLKLVAMLLMVVDHIGLVLFPSASWLRAIGRLSMPVFAYCLARGFHGTLQRGSLSRYFRSLVLFSVVSQVPYTVLSLGLKGEWELNIGFTWLCALCFLVCVRRFATHPVLFAFVMAAILGLAQVARVDYRWYGVLVPVVMYLFLIVRHQPALAFVALLDLSVLYVITEGGPLQLLSALAVPALCVVLRCDKSVRLPKWIAYCFYPAHIVVLLLISAVCR